MSQPPDLSAAGGAQPPALFDRALWLARRARRALPRPEARFLHEAAIEGVLDRLSMVADRTFPKAALVWPGAPEWAPALAAHPRVGALETAPLTAEEVLPLAPGGFDLAVLGFTLHWANDPVGVLIQMRRALKPDGLLIACGLGGATLAELREALAEAEAATTGGLSPRISPMGEIRAMGALLQRAGLAMPVADVDRIETSYADSLALMRELRAMGEANALHARNRAPLRRELLARACAIHAERRPAEGGRVAAAFEIVTLTGWAPGPDQPQARRPGSAVARLADALGTTERPTGDKPPR
ncbi:methyltransferase domain-containing protein [Albimonas pacifica]|uniref:Methyltransferase domain-containing protein n=1 Tax=Albimonas pacifica TaxID=1114924 RepID=A0A1I3KPC9_9RHOB|nr:methyltransferase domain-containing protein [Albimonas pacifica]SFI74349.1 Methyltransferase domain-containing protein [Albimonas pacifica]